MVPDEATFAKYNTFEKSSILAITYYHEPKAIITILHYTRSINFWSARLNGPNIRLPYSKCGLRRVLKSTDKVMVLTHMNDRLMRANNWLPFGAATLLPAYGT